MADAKIRVGSEDLSDGGRDELCKTDRAQDSASSADNPNDPMRYRVVVLNTGDEPPATLSRIKVHGKVKDVTMQSLCIFDITNPVRQAILSIVEWIWFDRFILVCIVINSIFLAAYQHRANPDEGMNWFISNIGDHVLTSIFTLECIFKVIAWGLVFDRMTYLRDGWNLLDFVVVLSGIVEWCTLIANDGESGGGSSLSSLRLFRVLRPLRSLNAVPQMKVLVNTILCSIPRLGNVFVMTIFLYIVFGIVSIMLMGGVFHRRCHMNERPEFILDPASYPGDLIQLPLGNQSCWIWPDSVPNVERLCGGRYDCTDELGTRIGYCGGHEQDLKYPPNFGEQFDGGMGGFPWCPGQEPRKVFPETDFVHFDHIPAALLLIFQCMTLEGWIELMYMVQDGYSTWGAWFLFFAIVLLTSFFLMNVTLAVIDEARDAFDEEDDEEQEEEEEQEEGKLSPQVTGEEKQKDLQELEEEALLRSDDSHKEVSLWIDCMPVRICYVIGESEVFQAFVMLVIAANVVTMCLETFPPQVSWESTLKTIELVILIIFCIEMAIMIIALGPSGYVKNPVTCFDGCVVLVSIVEMAIETGGGLKALRTLRLFRVLNKLANRFTSLKVLLKAMVQTASSLGYWFVLFFLLLYILTLFAVQIFATKLHFKDTDTLAETIGEPGDQWCPGTEGLKFNYRQDCIPRANFDTFWWGFIAIFQIMTGENWNTIMYACMRSARSGFDTVLFAGFFVFVILVGQTLFLSLFLSMLMSKFDKVQDEVEEKELMKLSNRQLTRKVLPTTSSSKMISPMSIAASVALVLDRAGSPKRRGGSSTETSDGVERLVQAEANLDLPGQLVEVKAINPADDVEDQQEQTQENQESEKEGVAPEEGGAEDDLLLIPEKEKWPKGYAWFILSETNPVRMTARRFLSEEVTIRGSKLKVFDSTILICIVISSVCMAVDTPLRDPNNWLTQIIRTADAVFAVIFIIEMCVKLCAEGLFWGRNAYLKSGWNWLDGIVVVVSIVDFASSDSASPLKILRICRALRPLRVISRNENLKVVVQTIFASIADLSSLLLVFFLFLIIYALLFLFFLAGKSYHCVGDDPIYYAEQAGDQFVTPLCIGSVIGPASINQLEWDPKMPNGHFKETSPGEAHWVEGTCDPTSLHPVSWKRASADTPICLAQCDGYAQGPGGDGPSESLCPRKYRTVSELPSNCGDDISRVKTQQEVMGERYVEAMQRSYTVPCGGSMVMNAESSEASVHMTYASSMSCRATFCPKGISESKIDSCRAECKTYSTLKDGFCAKTCGADRDSPECQSCLAECEASCQCSDYCHPLILDAALCSEQGGEWGQQLSQNFNNVWNSMLTLFEISTTEGWVDVMYMAADAVDPYRQPQRDSTTQTFPPFPLQNYHVWPFLFMSWILLSFMFLLNLSVGVIVDKFMDLKSQGKTSLLTEAQEKWISSRRTLHGYSMFYPLTNLHKLEPWRRKVYDVVLSKPFDNFIMLSIVLNTLMMLLTIFPSPSDEHDDTLMVFNYIFVAIFTVEAIMKLLALGLAYFKDRWNQFDFACCFATLFGIMLDVAFDIRVVTIIKVFRVFRVARLFRLLRFLKGLSRLFMALVISLPKLMNVVAILLLLLLLYGILGVNLFASAKRSETLNVHGNFQDFFWAFTTLFRGSTGEAWNEIMHDLQKDEVDFFREGSWCTPADLFLYLTEYDLLADKCLIDKPNACVQPIPLINSRSASIGLPCIYWCSYTIVIGFVIMNLVIAVILEGYEEGKQKPEEEAIDVAIARWKKYDPDLHMCIDFSQALLFINEVFLAVTESREDVIPNPVKSTNSFGFDLTAIPMKYAKAYALNVSSDNKVTFMSATQQVLRFVVLQNNMRLIADLEECDSKLPEKELTKLQVLERKATKGELKGFELQQHIAASKLQRLFRDRRARRRSTHSRPLKRSSNHRPSCTDDQGSSQGSSKVELNPKDTITESPVEPVGLVPPIAG